AREVRRAGITGGRVVELVLGRHREAEGAARRGGARRGDREVRDRGGAERDAVAGAGDRRVGRVGGRDGLAAGRLERGAEAVDAVVAAAARGEGGIARQHGLAVAAREVHRARVAGRRVVELVQGRDREAEGAARRGGARRGNREV